MLSHTVKQELETALETSLMLAEPEISVRNLAERLFDSEPGLVEQLKRPWIVERFIWMMNRRRQKIGSAQDQMLLPGFPSLPQRITLKDGRRPLLMQSNLKDLKEFHDVLLKRKRGRLRIVEKLITFMLPYAAKRSTITVAEVVLMQR